MENNDILFKKEEGVGTILLNRPERKNSFTLGMIHQWVHTLEEWRVDPDVKVIVVTGAGNAFCSGVDLATVPVKEERGPVDYKNVLWELIHRIPLILEDIDKPVIAALPGVAVGAGLDMALMCDLRFAADNARISEGYIKAGLIPGDGGCYYLPRLVGVAKALELFWTGDFIDAQEALRIGRIKQVFFGQKSVQILQYDARLNRCSQVYPVYVKDPIHFGRAKNDAATDRDGTAADIGAGSARRYRNPVFVRQFQN